MLVGKCLALAACTFWPILQLAKCVEEKVYMCDSEIYCRGRILDLQAKFRIFRDSKEYVDMPTSKSAAKVMREFNMRFPKAAGPVSKANFTSFLETFFQAPGTELIDHVPSDWIPEPQTLNVIKDKTYKKWAIDLNAIWKRLCKQINESVAHQPDRYSLIYVPHPFIVPGGRFREYYNWDTYYILRGALTSEMFLTAKNIIKNFAFLIDRFGFIPNGGRVYYLGRSQPPLFIAMVHEYYRATGDLDFVRTMLPYMEKEIFFWQTNRTIGYKISGAQETVLLFLYKTRTNVPRPESYFEDTQTAAQVPEEMRPALYNNIASTAESGWDFTSRFLTGNRTNLTTLATTKILPVDLNAFLCGNMKIMADMYNLLGNYSMSALYMAQYNTMKRHMMKVFYNESHGAWFDVNIQTSQHNLNFYPSNLVPLFTMCYEFDDPSAGFEKIYEYFVNSKAANYPTGVPTSLLNTSLQWDFPNGWPNLQHMVIEGFHRTNHLKLAGMAAKLADAWLRNNYELFHDTGYMYEKYDVTGHAQAGGGGEYIVQVGFGWTNGVALDLLRKFGHNLSYAKR